jgi:hypothetical protein
MCEEGGVICFHRKGEQEEGACSEPQDTNLVLMDRQCLSLKNKPFWAPEPAQKAVFLYTNGAGSDNMRRILGHCELKRSTE